MYLDLCVSSMIVISAGFNQPFKGVAINISIICVLMLVPFVFWKIISQNFERLATPEAVKQFGTLYTGVDTRYISKMTYTIVFLVRRFLFAIITAFIAKRYNAIALILVAYINVALQMYTTEVMPM